MLPDRAQLKRSWLRIRAIIVRVATLPIWSKLVQLFFSVFQPLLVAFAVSLILLIAHVYFANILSKVLQQSGSPPAVFHGAVGVFLLFNLLFNYYMCIRTSPGFTTDVDEGVLHQCSNESPVCPWTWCNKCAKPKPPLAHHCRICRRCVMKMDHHCPWMANCIGWGNYKHFFLVVFYLWTATGYLTLLLISTKRPSEPWSAFIDTLPTFEMLALFLCPSIFAVMCCFLAWHITLVLSGTGTIDFMLAWGDGESPWEQPHNLGWAQNVQVTFDVQGPLWWLRWCLPSVRKQSGWGYALPIAVSYQPVATV